MRANINVQIIDIGHICNSCTGIFKENTKLCSARHDLYPRLPGKYI